MAKGYISLLTTYYNNHKPTNLRAIQLIFSLISKNTKIIVYNFLKLVAIPKYIDSVLAESCTRLISSGGKFTAFDENDYQFHRL